MGPACVSSVVSIHMSSHKLNREGFSYDQEYDLYQGTVEVGGLVFEGTVKSRDGDMEQAWEKAARIFDFIDNNFDQIEKAVRRDFIPEYRHWAQDQEEEGYSDAKLGDLTIAAMRTDLVRFRIYADMISDVSFAGPSFLLGHNVDVRFDEKGAFLSIEMG